MTTARRERRLDVRDAGKVLARAVRELVPATSWNRARELCRSGRVWLDGTAATDPAAVVGVGQLLVVDPAASRARRPSAVEILHRDAHLVVAVKPAGISTVPFDDGEVGTFVQELHVELRRRERGEVAAPRVVQRLDKDTSGVLVFARTRLAERELQTQLRAHTVGRLYVALAHGRVDAGTFDTTLVPDRGDGLRGSWGVRFPPRGRPPETARRAITHVAVREELTGASVVECRLETGRQHQIRIHLAERGHPLLGERVYVRDFTGRWIVASRLMLHARTLEFVHPVTGENLAFTAPEPPEFQALVERLRPVTG